MASLRKTIIATRILLLTGAPVTTPVETLAPSPQVELVEAIYLARRPVLGHLDRPSNLVAATSK
jgi:hypothetical protein